MTGTTLKVQLLGLTGQRCALSTVANMWDGWWGSGAACACEGMGGSCEEGKENEKRQTLHVRVFTLHRRSIACLRPSPCPNRHHSMSKRQHTHTHTIAQPPVTY